jgi:zinc D-Ala-D-Ala carboxypeptidase
MKYFKINEFNCKCCGVQEMDQTFLAQLDKARGYAGTPFIINSGFRCVKHNAEVGSKSDNHPSGKAADIACIDGPERIKIITGLILAGFRRIEIGKTWVHADSMPKIDSLWLG